MSEPSWHPDFTPYYSPKQMLSLGVFEGKYINAIKGLPKDWYALPRVLGPDDDPDPEINKYGVKSRQPLSVWKKNGWTTKNSPLGWFEWYCRYWTGRRLPEEDEWQIGRWKSFVARHMGQVVASGDLKDLSKRLKQRQALLQWGWEATLPLDEESIEKAVKRLKRHPEVSMENRWLDW